MTQCLLLAVGGNFLNPYSDLSASMRHGVSSALRHLQLSLVAASSLYSTAPVGCPGRQPRYLNAVLLCRCKVAPAKLLRGLKRIEREAGRRARGINAPRPLDFDILDLGGRVMGWPRRSMRLVQSSRPGVKRSGRARREPRAWLTLPHPELHRRRFVLQPLAEVAPHWQHPVLKVTVRRLLARLPRRPGEIERTLDSSWLSCEVGANLHGQG
jgi:2-amino-4-hydroxy-6-hydroxymethyldihydropteridine diphosphokinase